MRRAFTLIELLVVIAIIALLAAILFPVFARAKAQAKQTQCLSNLKQIGSAIGLYMNDYDDVFPHALDAADKGSPDIWNEHPEFRARIEFMPMLHDVLQPYVKSAQVFHCPSDSGTFVLDNHFPDKLFTQPTLHAVYGSSYFFRTEIAFEFFTQTRLQLPADVNVLMDGAGHWHGARGALQQTDDLPTYFDKIRNYRYNVLFGDFHAKSIPYDALSRAWSVPL
jgi:general secretion pathway protein G